MPQLPAEEPENLEAAIAEREAYVSHERAKRHAMLNSLGLLSADDLATIENVTVNTIEQRHRRGLLPMVRLGSTLVTTVEVYAESAREAVRQRAEALASRHAEADAAAADPAPARLGAKGIL